VFSLNAYSYSKNKRINHLEFNEPLADPNKVICVIGDSGKDISDQYTVSEAMFRYGCTQVRIAGDVIYPSGIETPSDKGFTDKFLNPYKNMIYPKSPIRFFLVLGNHDHKGSGDAFLEAVSNYPTVNLPNFYYTEKWSDGVCVFNLDTDFYEKPKHWLKLRNFKESFWLSKARKRLKNKCKFTMAFGHHPMRSVGKHGDAKLVTKAFLKRNVLGKTDLYIAGHDHNLSDEGVEKGTRLLVSGAGASLRPLKYTVKTGNFGISELGFIAIRFKKLAGKIVADYKFEVIKRDQKGLATSNVKAVHKGFTIGKPR
jgi:hypothetical protein